MKSKEQPSGKWQLDLFGLLCDAMASNVGQRGENGTASGPSGGIRTASAQDCIVCLKAALVIISICESHLKSFPKAIAEGMT